MFKTRNREKGQSWFNLNNLLSLILSFINPNFPALNSLIKIKILQNVIPKKIPAKKVSSWSELSNYPPFVHFPIIIRKIFLSWTSWPGLAFLMVAVWERGWEGRVRAFVSIADVVFSKANTSFFLFRFSDLPRIFHFCQDVS